MKIIPHAFGEKAVLKLMFGAMIRASERWHAVRVSDFERRQMTAVKKEFDEDYENVTAFLQNLQKPHHTFQYPAILGLDQFD